MFERTDISADSAASGRASVTAAAGVPSAGIPSGNVASPAVNSEPAPRRSWTADIVSAARGIGVSRELRDPLAIHFASPDIKPWLEAFEPASRVGRLLRGVARRLSLGLVDHNTLRMVLIDGLLRDWLARGCRQVVIIGAGMDSRGWRLAELADARLFELDRAPTQAIKQARSADLPARCRDVRFVRADIERDPLADGLLRAGFRADEPTAWICEGVTPYLGVDTIARLLAQLAELSAPGSQLAMSYALPSSAPRDGRLGLAGRLAKRLGEPPRGLIAPAEIHRHLDAAGLACVADLGWKQWAARVPSYRPVRNVFKERLLIAERSPGSPEARAASLTLTGAFSRNESPS